MHPSSAPRFAGQEPDGYIGQRPSPGCLRRRDGVTRTRAQRPSKRGEYYCRLYWRFIDEYPEVFDDPTALGTYMQLLYHAETHWPSRASVPRSIHEDSLEWLEREGLVIFERGDRYTIKGLDAERERRQAQARKARAARGDGTGSGTASATPASPSQRQETREAETEAQAEIAGREDATAIGGELPPFDEFLDGPA